MDSINTAVAYLWNFSFSDIIGVIGYVTTGIIVLAVSIRSVIDVLKGTGVFYRKWMDVIYRNEDERIYRALEQAGVLSRVNHYKSLTFALNSSFVPMSNEECKKELDQLSSKFIEKENWVVGDETRQKVDYFLNLRKAFCDGYTEIMVKIICSYIMNEARTEGIVFDCIISRKSGFDLLGYLVSKVIGLPFVLYHGEKSILKNNSIKAFDYLPENIKSPIIIDDSCVGGSSIASLAKQFEAETKIAVKHAFILFTRKEESAKKLKDVGVKLHYLEFYDDAGLEKLMKQNSKSK